MNVHNNDTILKPAILSKLISRLNSKHFATVQNKYNTNRAPTAQAKHDQIDSLPGGI